MTFSKDIRVYKRVADINLLHQLRFGKHVYSEQDVVGYFLSNPQAYLFQPLIVSTHHNVYKNTYRTPKLVEPGANDHVQSSNFGNADCA